MMKHPEIDGPLGELIESIQCQELIDVWCKGCNKFRKANSAYAKFLQGEIESCGFCRKK